MDISYRRFRNGDEVALEELLKKTFPVFKENNLWFWKYRLNPSFDDSLVVIAEKDGELVGSDYWLLRDFKLSNNTQVKAVLGADVAVHPDYRSQGIGTGLIRFPRMSGFFKEKGILLSYVFGNTELNRRFYNPAAGYIHAPGCTTTYRKLFNCEDLKAAFLRIDKAIRANDEIRKQLEELVMCISFRLRGAPEFSVHIESETVYLEEGNVDDSDVLIEGCLPLSSLIIGGAVGMGDLVKSWLTGKIRIRRGFFKILKLRKAFMLFQAASSQRS